MAKKHMGESSLQALIGLIKSALKSKSNIDHTHDRVNGYKVVVSNTAPTVNDTTIITFVTG